MPTSSLPADRRRPPEFRRCSDLLPLRLRRQSSIGFDPQLASCFDSSVRELPRLCGKPIIVEVLPELSVLNRKLLSGAGRGTAVFAGSFIRERRIVLERSLLLQPDLFRAILTHELFHFVWVRLGNSWRKSFAGLLEEERDGGGRGELGDSSTVAKTRSSLGTHNWKYYVCESFCDTAAYVLTGSMAGACLKPGKRSIAARREWFAEAAAHGWKL